MKYCTASSEGHILTPCLVSFIHHCAVILLAILATCFAVKDKSSKVKSKESKKESNCRRGAFVCLLISHFILVSLPIVFIIIRVVTCIHCLSINEIAVISIQGVAWFTVAMILIVKRSVYTKQSSNTCYWKFVVAMKVFWFENAFLYIVTCILMMVWGRAWWTNEEEGTFQFYLKFAIFIVSVVTSVIIALFGFAISPKVDEDDPSPYIPLENNEEATVGAALEQVAESMMFTWNQLRKMSPYLWPKTWGLKFRVFVCILTFIALRITNVLLPMQYKVIVDYFSKNHTTIPTGDILLYMTMILLYGAGVSQTGLLDNIRLLVWVRIKQYASRTLQMQVFQHIHNLPLRWHIMRRTGKVVRALNRSAESIEFVAGFILFQVFPPIVDSSIAIVVFGVRFGPIFAIIFAVTMVFYVLTLAAGTQFSNDRRKTMNKKDLDAKAVATDSVLNFELVKYFDNENFEAERFLSKVVDYQNWQWKYLLSLRVIAVVLNICLVLGMTACLFYCASKVVAGKLTAGDFVMFVTYTNQIMAPLYQLSYFYRQLQQYLVDVDLVTDILNEEEEGKGEEDLPHLSSLEGAVEFKHVYFGYAEDAPLIKDLSFKVYPGQTLAIVGPSGAGKSTILRLLFRFYDLQSGAILIDGQDTSMVSRKSVRKRISVVPQDSVMFNDTVYYNINYGRIDANAGEVRHASVLSDMHYKISKFTDGYDTVVGERGLRLSGGEKQRVAIARTFLKDARIVVLDEATSSLDTKTERSIQEALNVVRKNKTTIIVAHRLSTIVNADWIIVLNEGEIAEQGTHAELLALQGLYQSMWQAQAHKAESTPRSSVNDESLGSTSLSTNDSVGS